MKGTNKILMNKATIAEAVQEYLRTRAAPDEAKVINVTDVTWENRTHYDGEFVVTVSDEAAKP